MSSNNLSLLIPARNEIFLKQTVEDALKKIEADTEIIVVLDGQWSEPRLEQHERVNIIYVNKSIGQRAAQNLACKLSKAKYVMKVDAHCSFDKGFDRKMIEAFKETGDNVTMTPIMRNLWAFSWKCMTCGKKWYMGPEPTKCQNPDCKGVKFTRKIKWLGKSNPQSYSYRFTNRLEFKYWNGYRKRQVGDIVDTMSLPGSCFMCTRENYWKKELCNESYGSWGGQGAEVALKTWLSGGEVKVNKRTWYAHMFRTQPGFSHPYPNPGGEQKKAKDTLREVFLNDRWSKAKYKLKWLIEKFAPVPDWTDKDLKKLKENEKGL